jgi:hypothetical protein
MQPWQPEHPGWSDTSSGVSGAGPSAVAKGKAPMTMTDPTDPTDPRQSEASIGTTGTNMISSEQGKGKAPMGADPRQSGLTSTTETSDSSNISSVNEIMHTNRTSANPASNTTAQTSDTAAQPSNTVMTALENPAEVGAPPADRPLSLSTTGPASATTGGFPRDSQITIESNATVASGSTVAGPSGTGGQ